MAHVTLQIGVPPVIPFGTPRRFDCNDRMFHFRAKRQSALVEAALSAEQHPILAPALRARMLALCGREQRIMGEA